MNSFAMNEEPSTKGKYYISVAIVIYRALHGKYPDFLQGCETERNAREGYPTKFCYLTEEVMLEKKEAENKLAALEEKYGETLRECENSGDWSKSPFDFSKMELLWMK
jgi:hypothetical protein